MRGSTACAVCALVVAGAALLAVYVLYRRRLREGWPGFRVALRDRCVEAMERRASGVEEPGPRPPPLVSSLALLPLQKWDTIQNMMRWRGEMSSLDGLMQDLDQVRGERSLPPSAVVAEAEPSDPDSGRPSPP